MTICPQCGAELPGGRFCVQCGAPLASTVAVPPRESNGFGAYMLKRTVLLAIKIVLFALILFYCWKFDLFKHLAEFKSLPFLELLIPHAAYAIAALICAPFKIALSERRLRDVGSSRSLWFLAWFLTIVARFWLSLYPAGFFFAAFCDSGPTVVPFIVLLVMNLAPLATVAAYAFEFSLLWKPRVKNGDLRNDAPSV